MISYVKGTIAAIEGDVVVVETGGIGYEVHVPLSLLDELPKQGEEAVLHTYFQVREDAMTLYGFLHRQDRDMFRQLLGVNGIGPKGALGILSALRPDQLRLAIVSGDAKAISRAQGVGIKTAQRLILDLKDKMPMEVLSSETVQIQSVDSGSGETDAAREAVAALTALGYTNLEASKAVRKVTVTEEMTAEDVLKASLKFLTFL